MVSNWTSALSNLTAVFCCVCFVILECGTEKVLFLNLERPQIDSFDPAYFANPSTSSRRYNRSDTHHYMNLEFRLLKFDNQLCFHSFTFYELLSARNKRRIVELQYDVCDWLENDRFFAVIFREAFAKTPKSERPMAGLKCPLMPGKYVFNNMVVPMLRMPVKIPIQDGRISYNMICKHKSIGKLHVDFQVVEKNIKNA